jgi:hypothetical protein
VRYAALAEEARVRAEYMLELENRFWEVMRIGKNPGAVALTVRGPGPDWNASRAQKREIKMRSQRAARLSPVYGWKVQNEDYGDTYVLTDKRLVPTDGRGNISLRDYERAVACSFGDGSSPVNWETFLLNMLLSQ